VKKKIGEEISLLCGGVKGQSIAAIRAIVSPPVQTLLVMV